MSAGICLAGVVLCLFFLLYTRMNKTYQHWISKGISGPKPLPLFGNFLPLVTLRKSIAEILIDAYQSHPSHRMVGIYAFMQPQLLLRDPKDIETVLVKEFSSFTDRINKVEVEREPYLMNLLALGGSRWKAFRTTIAPMFSTCKLKDMIHQVSHCWHILAKYIHREGECEVEMKNLTDMFVSDVVASTAFGIDPQKLGEPNTEFRIMSQKYGDFSFFRLIALMARLNFPKIGDKIGMKVISDELENYFVPIVKKTMEWRRNTGKNRKDFIQLMLDLQDKGSVSIPYKSVEDEYLLLEDDAQEGKVVMTDDLVVSQAFLFIAGGYVAISLAMTYTLAQLTNHPDKMEKAVEEVDMLCEKYPGKFPYESLQEMTYLHMCIQETLRLQPGISFLQRICTKRCQLEGGLTLEVGDVVVVSSEALHRDPRYWDNPNLFLPERFHPDKKHLIHPFTYLPFGQGPRMCIAMRYAEMVLKLGLVHLLREFHVSGSPKNQFPIRYDPKNIVNKPVQPVFFKFSKRPRVKCPERIPCLSETS